MNDRQTLTLEAGKYYKTRDGRKAFVGALNQPSPFGNLKDMYPAAGYIEGEDSARSWMLNGELYNNAKAFEADLVAEWVEPKRIKGWVNIYAAKMNPDDGDIQDVRVGQVVHNTRELAAKYQLGKLIACIEIDVLEGHGLNEEGA